MTLEDVLSAVPSTESATFSEFCGALKDCPTKGDRESWREVFKLLNDGVRLGWVYVAHENGGTSGPIEAVILTESGAAHVRALLDAKRGLLGLL